MILREIKQFHKHAAHETLNAIICFHEHEIDHSKVKIKKGKKALNSKNCRLTKPVRVAQAVNNDATIETVKQIAVYLQVQITQFGTMMEKLGAIENKDVKKYTCVFSDSHHKHGAIEEITNFKSHLLQRLPRGSH